MIDYLRHIAVFSRVAQEGSFAKAAKSLGLAPSRVSESVSKLEHYVGFTLIARTTRKISLTSEGRTLYESTSGILEDAERGIDALKEASAVPMGSLRIATPTYLSATLLAPAIGRFVAQNPQVHISAEFTDRAIDPAKDGYDMCIRAGRADDRTVNSRTLGQFERAVAVGKGYRAKQGKVHHPQELMNWDWISYRHTKRSYALTSPKGETTKLIVKDQARLVVDNIEALYAFVCIDAGVTVMPLELLQRGVREGKLERLFEDWELSKVQYSALWPDKSNRASLAAHFAEFLSDYVGSAD